MSSKRRRGKFSNSRKDRKLRQLHITDLTVSGEDLAKRCKFNFSYLDTSQEAGVDFSELSQERLNEIMQFMKEMGKGSLEHWKMQKRYSEYGKFPEVHTDFEYPRYVPIQVRWGRFRLNNTFRLVGFTIPPEFDQKINGKYLLDKNTFYRSS